MKLRNVYKKAIPYSFLITGACFGLINAQGNESGVNQFNPLNFMNTSEIKTSGFAATSYVAHNRADADGDSRSFSFDEFELDLESKSGSATFRVDLDFFTDSAGGGEYSFGTGSGAEVEQAYIGLENFYGVSGLNLQVGKWNAPLGLESFDYSDRGQYSLSTMFYSAIPANMTGVYASYEVMDGLTAEASYSNGYDNNVDNNNDAALTLGLTYVNEGMGITAAYDHFTGNSNQSSDVGPHSSDWDINDVWVQLDLGTHVDSLKGSWIAVEWLQGTMEEEHTIARRDAQYTGTMVKAYTPLSLLGLSGMDDMGLTLRYEDFNDSEGVITGGTANAMGYSGSGTVRSFTSALNFVVPDTDGAVTGNLEYRRDWAASSATGDFDADGRNSSEMVAANLIYKF